MKENLNIVVKTRITEKQYQEIEEIIGDWMSMSEFLREAINRETERLQRCNNELKETSIKPDEILKEIN